MIRNHFQNSTQNDKKKHRHRESNRGPSGRRSTHVIVGSGGCGECVEGVGDGMVVRVREPHGGCPGVGLLAADTRRHNGNRRTHGHWTSRQYTQKIRYLKTCATVKILLFQFCQLAGVSTSFRLAVASTLICTGGGGVWMSPPKQFSWLHATVF